MPPSLFLILFVFCSILWNERTIKVKGRKFNEICWAYMNANVKKSERIGRANGEKGGDKQIKEDP